MTVEQLRLDAVAAFHEYLMAREDVHQARTGPAERYQASVATFITAADAYKIARRAYLLARASDTAPEAP